MPRNGDRGMFQKILVYKFSKTCDEVKEMSGEISQIDPTEEKNWELSLTQKIQL